MNSRFTESCRNSPLELTGQEQDIEIASRFEGRGKKELSLACEKDIYIGVFFDGTNNNKYRDTPSFSQSNVARLYEVYPGTPAAQAEPTLKPRVLPNNKTVPRPVFPDLSFKPRSVAADDLPYYRKVYVPGLGTQMPDIGDAGSSIDQFLGLGAAWLGQARLDWALLQFVNQIHAAVFKVPLEASVDLRPRWGGVMAGLNRFTKEMMQARPGTLDPILRGPDLAGRITESVGQAFFETAVSDYERRLRAALKQRGDNKPTIRKIRLSVFGFSRGAAAARAWVNLVMQRWGSSVAGIELQIDFLGVFDTVASVGKVNSLPLAGLSRSFAWSPAGWEGHSSWAGGGMLRVPVQVKRCVHLVAAMEVRGCFPLDSICQGGKLPSNCKEIVYPGVHSDVGGGYAPDEQGRALGLGAAGDPSKLSQIPLGQMYREARMAGVPLAPSAAMDAVKAQAFLISRQLLADFNSYVKATQRERVPPPRPGLDDAISLRMFPTETQPREETFVIIRRHYGIMLRWRKSFLNRLNPPTSIASLPCLQQATGESKYQDIEDFRGAEAELRNELVFLRNQDSKKFDSALYSANKLDKQHEWDTWLRYEWENRDSLEIREAAGRMFERHVHDSRAWFKVTRHVGGMPWFAPTDEDWFVFGKRDRETASRLNELNEGNAMHRDEIERLKREGVLLTGDREDFAAWGYIRHRALYESGTLLDLGWDARQKTLDNEEATRRRSEKYSSQMAKETERHRNAMATIDSTYQNAVRRRADSGANLEDLRAGAASQTRREMSEHANNVNYIEATYGPSPRITAGSH